MAQTLMSDTHVCRVETHLDAFRRVTESACSESVGAGNFPVFKICARGRQKRPDESGRGRHECLRHEDL